MRVTGDSDLLAVERAMVAIRRSQGRRSLARLAARQDASYRRVRLGAAAGTATFEVLDVVEAAEQTGIPVGVSDVAAAMGVDQPRASKLVAAAVEAGLIRREADQADGRRTLLARTRAGRAVCDRVHSSRRAVFTEVMAGWPTADRARFARLLTRFVEGLTEVTRQSPL